MSVEPPASDGVGDNCEQVLQRMYEFLDSELDTASGDQIRRHLADCEPCLEAFDLETAVKSLVKRRCGGDVAPSHLRVRVMEQITVVRRTLQS